MVGRGKREEGSGKVGREKWELESGNWKVGREKWEGEKGKVGRVKWEWKGKEGRGGKGVHKQKKFYFFMACSLMGMLFILSVCSKCRFNSLLFFTISLKHEKHDKQGNFSLSKLKFLTLFHLQINYFFYLGTGTSIPIRLATMVVYGSVLFFISSFFIRSFFIRSFFIIQSL